MRQIMKAAVDRLYSFLVLKQRDKKAYDALISLGERYTTAWDDPGFHEGDNQILVRRGSNNLRPTADELQRLTGGSLFTAAGSNID